MSGPVLLGSSIKERNTELSGRCNGSSPLERLLRTSQQRHNGLYLIPRVTSIFPLVAVRGDRSSNTSD